LRQLAEAGAGAVVLPSLFEEELTRGPDTSTTTLKITVTNGQPQPVAATNTVDAGGFATGTATVYDITDPQAVRLAADLPVSAGRVAFADGSQSGSRRYWIADAQGFGRAAIAAVAAGTDLHAATNQADYLIIAPSGFADAAHRESYAHQVFATLARGGRFVGRDGEVIVLPPHDLPPSLTIDISDRLHTLAVAQYTGAEWIPTSCTGKCDPTRDGNKVDVRDDTRSALISVAAKDVSPFNAQKIANAYVQAYIDIIAKSDYDRLSEIEAQLRRRLAELKQQQESALSGLSAKDRDLAERTLSIQPAAETTQAILPGGTLTMGHLATRNCQKP